MATLKASLSIAFSATQTGDNTLTAQVHSPSFGRTHDFANGVLAKQADILYADELTIAGGAFVDIDLNGSLTNAAGVPVTALKIASIALLADPTNTTVLTVGGAPANAFVGPFGAATHTLKLAANGQIAFSDDSLAGLGPVTAGTADLLRIANAAGAAAKVKVAIVGRSA
jgi:hypothetical protein